MRVVGGDAVAWGRLVNKVLFGPIVRIYGSEANVSAHAHTPQVREYIVYFLLRKNTQSLPKPTAHKKHSKSTSISSN